MRGRLAGGRLGWVAIAVALLAGCTGDPLITREQELMAKARTHLSRDEYSDAQTALLEVTKDLNPSNSEAYFLLFVAEFQKSLGDLSSQLSGILALFDTSSDTSSQGASGGTGGGLSSLFGSPSRGQTTQLQGVNALIQPILQGLLVDKNKSMVASLRKVAEDRDFEIVYDPFPIKMNGSTLVDLGGRYDLGEVYLFIGLFELIEALGHFVLTIDFDLDLAPVIQLLADPNATSDTRALLEGIVKILNRSPEMLTLSPVGRAEMRAFVDTTFASLGDIVNAVFVTATRRRQPDDFFAIETRHVLPTEPGCQPAPAETPLHQTLRRLCILLRMESSEGKLVEVGIPASPELVTAAAGMADAIFQTCSNRVNGKAVDCRISWARHFVPLLANLIPPLLSSGALFTLLQPLVAGTETETIFKQAEGVFVECAPFINPEMLSCTMLKFIPDVLELDAQVIMRAVDDPSEGYIRDWMPCWTSGDTADNGGGPHGCHITPLATDTDFRTNGAVSERFLMETECGSDPLVLPKDVTCETPSADGVHFKHAIYGRLGIGSIEADGVQSGFPYLSMRDPSLTGLLWLNPAPFGSLYPLAFSVDNRFTAANLRDLNLLVLHVGKLLGPILAGDIASVVTPVVDCLTPQLSKASSAQLTKCINSAIALIPSTGG
ncbi:MAG: hypothetical protein HYY13_05990 [Nitrospirae bacterium]|nr:hypothetical protein [Nitrospirota bacterium]